MTVQNIVCTFPSAHYQHLCVFTFIYTLAAAGILFFMYLIPLYSILNLAQ